MGVAVRWRVAWSCELRSACPLNRRRIRDDQKARSELIPFAVLSERTPLADATQLKSRTATPIRGIAELGVHAPPNTAADEPRVASKTERDGVVHGSWTKRGEYAAAAGAGSHRGRRVSRRPGGS